MSGPTIMGLILFALGIFVCYQGIDLTVGIPSQPGPGFVPFGLGSVLVVLAAIFLYQSSHQPERKEALLTPCKLSANDSRCGGALFLCADCGPGGIHLHHVSSLCDLAGMDREEELGANLFTRLSGGCRRLFFQYPLFRSASCRPAKRNYPLKGFHGTDQRSSVWFFNCPDLE